MKVRISGNGGHREINLPVKDAELAHLAKLVGDGTENLWYRLEYVQEERNPLQKLIGQKVNMDEVNFFAKRMESLSAYEQGVLETYAAEQGMETVKDLINLTYSMKGLSLITDFSDGREVGRRLYMDEHLGISEEESRRMDFEAYGKKVLAEGNCKILPGGVFVTQGFEMQEVYNGRTFPEYVYDVDRTVAVLELKSKAGGRDYLYLPTDFYSVNLMKERLRIQGLWECSVEEVHNLRLPESLVPGLDRLRCVEELTFFNEMCAQVSWFAPESMKRLEMAVELAGAETYTDVTYIARNLNEFEAVPSVHNDEEYGKFLVTKSGIFEVDELLLPHIDYAGVAADKRDGTLAASGYVSGGFVGTEREIHEYLEYDGEFASPLERDSDCYQRFCLYSPLGGSLMVDGEDAETLYSRDLVPYVEEIGKAVYEDGCASEDVRGLMHYFDRDREVAAKIASAWPSVKEVDGELYGVLNCEIVEPLTEGEIHVLKDYWTGQMSDGWGEGFEQQPIQTEDGELYVSFWGIEDFWKLMTAEELGIEQEQGEQMDGGMRGMDGPK